MKRILWALLEWPLGLALFAWSWLVRRTVRLELRGAGARYKGSAVFVNWHRHLPLLVPLHGRAGTWFMMSAAPHMAPIARWAKLWGLQLVRGASGEGGREALDELARKVREGGSVALAVDGPHGPAFHVKPGCVQLARACGVPIIPMAYRARLGTTLPRWDRSLWVWPFTKVIVEVGAPLQIGELPDAAALSLVAAALDALEPERSAKPEDFDEPPPARGRAKGAARQQGRPR